MLPSTTDELLVLRRVEYGDSDLIVTALTRERGKIVALARGARRSKRRFGAALGLFNVSSVSLVRRPRRELWELSGADLRREFAAIASDVAAMAHASYGTELVRELLPAEQPEPGIFELVVELYETLAQVGASAPALRAFELRLLAALGFAPVLTRCVRCDADLPMGAGEGARLFSMWGGVACAPCAGETVGRDLGPGARALLVAAATLPLAQAASDLAGADRLLARQARDAMVSLVLGHVGKPLRSLEFIAKLRGGGAAQDTTNGREA